VRPGWLLVLALLPATGAGAAETLEEAWQKAAQADPALAAAAADSEAATAARRSAQAGRLPTVIAAGSASRLGTSPSLAFSTPDFSFQSPPIFKDDLMVVGGVEVRLPLFTGGRVSAGIRAAKAAEGAAGAMQDRAAADLRLAVATAYVDVLRARRAAAAAAAAVASLDAHAGDVAALVERGLVPQSDLLAARVALAQVRQQQLTADNGAALARAAYNRLLGEPLDREVELAPALPAIDLAGSESVAALTARAVAARPELAALEARGTQLRAESAAENGRRLPQVALTGGWQHVSSALLDREDFSMVGVGVQWQLFDGGATRQRARSLAHAARAAGLRAQDARSGIELQVRGAWLAVQEADARVKVGADAVVQAEENERQSRELYGADLATNTQVLDAVRLRLAATAGRDDAQMDAGLSRLRLAHAVGEL
jgi:outer membrane protein